MPCEPSKIDFLPPPSLGNSQGGAVSENQRDPKSDRRRPPNVPGSDRARRLFAVSATLLMLLVAFAVLPREARAGVAQPLAPPPVTYGPGWRRTANPDGTVEMTYLRTFQRWDGAWRPATSLNQSTGEWPYQLTDGPTTMSVTRLGAAFVQAKLPGASYEFRPETLKETITVPTTPPPVLSVALTTTGLSVALANNTVLLNLPGGPTMWTAGGFHAWDSTPFPQMWPNAVSSMTYSNGVLSLTLNSAMLAQAVYPLYVDPTWTLSSTLGWGASAMQNVVEDKGDHNLKIGWLADNFNANISGDFTIDAGAVTFTGGVMQMPSGSSVHAGGSWSDQNFAFTVNFVTLGSVGFEFRKVDVNNRYQLLIAGSTGYVALEKWVGGVGTTLGSFNTPISAGTTYSVKIVATGVCCPHFQVYWQGLGAIFADDNVPPFGPSSGFISVWTGATNPQIKVDDVRIWSPVGPFSGTITSAVRDAGTNRPLLERVADTGATFARVDSQILTSTDNATWSDAHYVKVRPKSSLDYSIAESDQNRYYRARVTLRATDDGTSTPSVSEITTTEGTPATPLPSTVLGYERWQYYVGGLVHVVDGNLFHSEKDVGLPGKGFPIEFRRSYNSFQVYSGTLGLGWTHNYNVSLSGSVDVTMYDGDGSRHVYASLGSNQYSSPSGLTSSKLEKNGDSTYSLYWTDGERWNFTSVGRLSLISNQIGQTLTFNYDGNNRLWKILDGSGLFLELLYDVNGRISTVRDQTLRSWTFQYTSNRLTSVTDPRANSTLYRYDATNRLEKVIDRANKMTRFVYDLSSHVTEIWLGLYNRGSSSIVWQYRWYTISGYANTRTRTVTDSNNVASTLTLDERGTPKNITGPLAGSGGTCCAQPGVESVESQWDGERNRVVWKDGKGYRWNSSYDYFGNELTRFDPTGNMSSYRYDNRETGWYVSGLFLSLLWISTNFRGKFWSYDYGDCACTSNGQLGRSIDPLRSQGTWFAYDSAGFLQTLTDPMVYTTTYTHDGHGWLTQVKNPLNFVSTYAYDALGRQINATSPLGFRTLYEYDGLDRLTKVTDPLGNFTRYAYDARGDRTSVTDPNGYVTQFEANMTNGHTSKITEAGGNYSVYGFDTRGNLVTFRNPRGFVFSYQYDAYSRKINETTPGGNYTRFTYDRNGNVRTRIDAKGNLTTYEYDKLNQVTKITYPGSVVVTSQYDANGNIVQTVGFGYTRTQSWDNLDRPTSAVDNYGSFSKTFGYQYDGNSHRTRMNYSDGSFVTYFYNSAGWLTYENHSDGRSWSFGYDNNGRRTTENFPNSALTTTRYDKSSRVTNIWTNRSGSVLESFAYTYDKAGHRKMMTEANGSWAKYSYDNLYRLLNESYSTGRSIGYTYDANGNRNTSREVKVGGSLVVTTYSYGKEDQLLRAVIAGGATTTYTYDKNGNLQTRVSGSVTTTYTYDSEDRLTSTTTSSSTSTYGYTADGRRMKRISGGATTYFGNDPMSPSGYDDTIEEYGSSGTKSATYVHGTDADEVLGYKTTVWYSYHEDALGSVTRLTDSAGGTTSTYRYDAFGATRAQTGSSNTYGFTSRESEAAPGLYYNRARYYDPGNGRFLGADPVDGGYAYVGDSPPNFVDPTGMLPRPPAHHAHCPIGGGCSGGAPLPAPAIQPSSKLTSFACVSSILMFVGGLALGFLGIYMDMNAIRGGLVVASSAWGLDLGDLLRGGDIYAWLTLFLDVGSYVLMSFLKTAPWYDIIWTGAQDSAKLTPLGVGMEAMFLGISIIWALPGLINDCSG